MARPWNSDILGVLKGVQSVVNALVKHQGENLKQIVDNSSVKTAAEANLKEVADKLKNIDPSKVPETIYLEAKELLERINVVEKGILEFTKHRASEITGVPFSSTEKDGTKKYKKTKLEVYDPSKDPKEVLDVAIENITDDGKSPGFGATIFHHESMQLFEGNVVEVPTKYSSVKEKIENIGSIEKSIPKIKLSDKDKKLLRKLELEHEKKISSKVNGKEQREVLSAKNGVEVEEQVEVKKVEEVKSKNKEVQEKVADTVEVNVDVSASDEDVLKSKMRPIIKPRVTLSPEARPRKVPSSRIQRMVSFGTLGIGLGIGTLAEYGRRTLGLKDVSVGKTLDNVFLTKANAERIVETLCKVRGAALKIGQILSIQDNNVISPELQKAFERVRQSADFMPTWQVEKVLASELGHDWRNKVKSFEEKPFAAASIGQVHMATLHSGQTVAMKIQYPGVAEGIQSDIDNLVGVLKVWNMFPDGMFIDNVVEVAKRELAWEVDYVREAECSKKFKEFLAPYPHYYVPSVIDELSTKQILTTELIEGVPVDKCEEMNLETREHICKLIMHLCLKELFVFYYMQTDPNWANFFYNPTTRQMVLLDFGACRSYDKKFMDKYIEIINAASLGDRNRVLLLSREMKFLTGYESKLMENAHVDAVMMLGEIFHEKSDKYDFGRQNVTKDMQSLVPTIITHRLCPPPEEIYSLHRKLSGVFLLCAKLKVKIDCRVMFRDIYRQYRFD